jgi:molecular chaperone DnaK (HSP70)
MGTQSYAVDFGTSNTVVTRWNEATQSVEVVKLPRLEQQLGENPPLIPSVAYVKEGSTGEVLLGQQVRDRGLDLAQDPRFFQGFKRGIGSEIQGFLPELDGVTMTFEQVGEWFVGGILKELPETPESLVLTVPVDSFEAYRHWLTQVCQSLDINQIRIIDEPTAAALGYGATEANNLLVVDFGGGTVDLSLVQLNLGEGTADKPLGFILKWGERFLGENSRQKPRTAKVIGKAGESLGGSDIDNWLLDYFSDTQNLPQSPLTTRLAERLKIKLSTRREAEEVYFNDQTFESYELSLDREKFEEILRDRGFFDQLDTLMSQVLQQGRRKGLEINDIDAVLLVGGTTQIPAVQEWVLGYFNEKKVRSEKPFSAIAEGALQLAQGIELQDFLYHSYGIRYWNRRDKRHSWHPIIKAGQAYPMPNPVEIVLGASVEKQPSIELIIGEIGTDTGKTEVYFENGRLVTRTVGGDTSVQPLNDRDGARSIAQLDPVGNPGRDRVKVKFWVDTERSLRLSVEDLLTEQMLLENQVVAQLS